MEVIASISKGWREDEVKHSCIHSVNTYLMNPYCVPETVWGAWVTLMNKTDNGGTEIIVTTMTKQVNDEVHEKWPTLWEKVPHRVWWGDARVRGRLPSFGITGLGFWLLFTPVYPDFISGSLLSPITSLITAPLLFATWHNCSCPRPGTTQRGFSSTTLSWSASWVKQAIQSTFPNSAAPSSLSQWIYFLCS